MKLFLTPVETKYPIGICVYKDHATFCVIENMSWHKRMCPQMFAILKKRHMKGEKPKGVYLLLCATCIVI